MQKVCRTVRRLSHIAYWKSKPQPLSLSVYALTNVGLGALVMYSLSEYTSEIIPASCFENMAKKSFPLTPIFTSPLITSKLLMAVFSVLQTPSKTYCSLAISKPFSATFHHLLAVYIHYKYNLHFLSNL